MEIKLNRHVDRIVTGKDYTEKTLPLDEYTDAINVN